MAKKKVKKDTKVNSKAKKSNVSSKLKKEIIGEKKVRIKLQVTRKKVGLAAIFIVVSILLAIVVIFWGIPLPDNLSQNQAVSTQIFDRNGKIIYEIFADERRTPVKLSDLPDSVKNSTISIEDKSFYEHGGFSVTGMIRAAYKTLTGQRLEGGSTLTQQLVKNSLLTPERTLRRKIQELLLSIIVETRYSKDQILELYLNQVPYGSTAYGIESAAELYFGKSSKDLDLAQSALLAGLLTSPTKYSPFGANPDFAKARQKTVLKSMVENNYISQEESDAAFEETITYAKPKNLNAPHFALWIKDQLAEKYGDAVVEKGGLRVITTLDLDLQEFAQNAVATEVAKLKKLNVGNGAAIVTKPSTGEILTMVGSKDYNATDEDGKVNIIFANRQPGSSIKPINYALAIRDHKITASTPLADIPTCFAVAGQAPYCPVNYDGQFHGSVQARFALGNSFNVPAVRILALNGVENFVNFARDMGLTTLQDPSKYGLSLTLGGGEVRPIDMATAYGVFANGGIRESLISILKVTDWKGNVLLENKPEPLTGPRILESDVSFLISHILQDNNARELEFGPSSFLVVRGHPEVSVKTGTTNDRRDNWTIGYSPQAVVTVWVGNNDNTSMSGAVSGISGASPIFNKVIKYALDKSAKGDFGNIEETPTWIKQPDTVTGSMICANTGYIPNDASNGCPERFEFFMSDTVPVDGAIRMDIPFDRATNTYNPSDILPENTQMENHLVIKDPLGTIVCLDCAFPMGKVNINYPLVHKQ